jgi:peptide/nickel transport system substrate-binding protein
MDSRRTRGLSRRAFPRRTFVRGLVGAGAATGIASLAACASPSPAPTAVVSGPPAPAPPAPAQAGPAATPTPAAPQAKLGGTFRLPAAADSADLDPHGNTTANLHIWGAALAYNKLLQFRTDSAVKPGEYLPTGDLAESWEQADDLTYIFKLRPNVRFHNIAPVNGRAVVAEDVKFSFERQVALRTLAARLAGVGRIEAVDPRTVKITLEKPDADFLVTLAHYHNKILPKESVDVNGDLKQGPVIGAGPWIFEKWEQNSLATLTKNRDYYQPGLPRLDRLEFPRLRDAATRFGAFRAQQVDVLLGIQGFTPRDAETIRQSNPDIVLESYKGFNNDLLAMNVMRPPFNDLRARQGILKAIDKQPLIDTALDGKGWYFAGVFMPREDHYLPEAEMKALYKQDLPAARRLLAEAGVAPGTPFEAIVSQARDSVLDMAQLVKAQLAEVGILVNLRPVDTPTLTRIVYQERAYQFLFGSMAGGVSANGDLFLMHHSSGSQRFSAISDPAIDALIERQATMTRDPEGRKRLLQEIQRALINNAHQIVMYGIEDQRLRWKYVQDLYLGGLMHEPFTTAWLDK